MSTRTYHLPTATSVTIIHRAQRLVHNMSIPQDERNSLTQLIDAVLSFTAFFLRYENPKCRPEQLAALKQLTDTTKRMETLYGTARKNPEMANSQ